MTWLTWRQFRIQAIAAAAALAAFAILLAVTGPHLASLYTTSKIIGCHSFGCATAVNAFLSELAGLDTLVVPYKGTAPALTDLVSGQIQLLADPMLSSLPLARAGKIKALGLTSLKRAIAAPEIPTVEESGVKGFEFVSWYGLWGPRGLPTEVNAVLQEALAKVLALPEVKQRLGELGFGPIGSTSEQFAKYIETEMAKYAAIIRDAKIGALEQ